MQYKGRTGTQQLPDEMLITAKKDGFSDKYLSQLLEIPEEDIRNRRLALGVEEAWEGVHVSGTQSSAYFYSTYNAPDKNPVNEDRKKIMILGGGPNRIGQGIEFDYCCVHAAIALKKLGFETIIVNCNPETVSTDYDTSDKLYFEPLTLEDVLSIYKKEKPLGVIAQFSVEDNNELLCLESYDPTGSSFSVYTRVGQRSPLYSTSAGKAILSTYSTTRSGRSGPP